MHFSPNDDLWLEYKKRYQSKLKTLFQQPDKGPQFNEKLFQLLMEPDVFRSDELNQVNAENTLIFKQLLLNMIAISSGKQRKKLIKKINGFAKNAQALMQK